MERKRYKDDILSILPLIIVVAVIPLIVRLKIVYLDDLLAKYWSSNVDMDFFSYYKMVALLITSCIAAIITYFKISTKKKEIFHEFKYYLVPVCIFLVCALISTILSDYKKISIFGFTNRYEGLLVLVSYIIIFVSAMFIIKSEKQLKALIYSLITGSVIIGVIGFFQSLGYDIFNTSIGQALIVPSEYRSGLEVLTRNLNSQVYSTLYHHNYVGSYLALLIPFFICLTLFSRKLKYRILLALLSLFSIYILFASTSRAGLVGTIFSLIVMFIIIVLNPEYRSKLKYIGILFLAVILIGVITNQIFEGYIRNRVAVLVSDVKSIFVQSESTNETVLTNLEVGDRYAVIETPTEMLKIELLDGGVIQFKGNNSSILSIEMKQSEDKSENIISFLDEKYKDYETTIRTYNEGYLMGIVKKNTPIGLFYLITKDKLQLVDPLGNPIYFQEVKSWGFENKEKMGSARGYIWSRSIPMLKNTLLWGYGPDTFALEFPQHDLLGKLKAYDTLWMLVDKPHNLYLQSAINTGCLSLLALMAIFLRYIYESWRIFKRAKINSLHLSAGLGVYIGVIGYLVTGFFNDSVVSVAPVFWVMLGMGVAINYSIKKADQKSSSVKMKILC